MNNVPDNLSILNHLEQDYSFDSLNSSILNSIDAFVFIFDVEHVKPIWLNDFFYKKLKYTKEDFKNLTSEKFISLFHPDSLQQFTQRLTSIKDNNSEPIRSIYRMKTKNGRWMYMLICSRVFKKKSDGSTKLLLGFATEVEKSELKKHLTKIKELDNKYEEYTLLNKLSKRELDIIRLISLGLTDKEIAEKLKISIHTTKTHRKRIISKMGLKNTATLVKFAVENGIC